MTSSNPIPPTNPKQPTEVDDDTIDFSLETTGTTTSVSRTTTSVSRTARIESDIHRNAEGFSPERCILSLEWLGAKIDENVRKIILESYSLSSQEVLKRLKNRTALHEKQVYRAFSDGLGIPFVDMDWISANPNLLQMLPVDIWQKHRAFPLSKINNILEVAMANPLGSALKLLLERRLGVEVTTMCATPSQVDQYLSLEKINALEVQRSLSAVSNDDLQLYARQIEKGNIQGIVELGRQIIGLAKKIKASDIHIEPLDGEARIRMRVDGQLREFLVINKKAESALIGYFKVAANMDISEKRLPQDSHMHEQFGSASIDLRISTTPTIHGEKVCIRVLDQSVTSLRLDSLDFSQRILQPFRRALTTPNGLFIVTGPTGSGKTTTLYGCLSEVSDPTLNVTTIEDPVEYQLGGINQVQVHTKIGLTFPAILRSVLRQDPDIILIGEIRDAETASIAIKAALTGHKVLSTLHTNTAPDAITRLRDLNIPSYLISQALIGALGQRLVRRLCDHCRQGAPATDEQKALLGYTGEQPLVLFTPQGCDHCRQTGFTGRIPVQELFLCDDTTRRHISTDEHMSTIEQSAWEKGYRPLSYDALVKALAGLTTLDDVLRLHTHRKHLYD